MSGGKRAWVASFPVVEIEAYGLDDAGMPLTIVARCKACGAQVSRHTYRKDEYQSLSMGELNARILTDASASAKLARQHTCTSH